MSYFRLVRRAVTLLRAFLIVTVSGTATLHAADFGSGFKTQAVAVDGGVVSVTLGGNGPAVVLIRGYAETSRM